MLRVKAVAQRLDCSISTVYALINTNLLGHHRCPGIRVSEDQLQRFLDETKRERSEPPPRKAANPLRPVLRHISL